MGTALANALRTAAAMRADPRPIKVRKWPRPLWPHAPRLEYYRVLLQFVEAVQRIVLRDLVPKLPAILGAHNIQRPEPEAIRHDATGTEIDDAFEALHGEAERVIPEHLIEMAAQKNALRVTAFNGKELQKQIQRVAKVNLFDSTTGLAEHLEVFVADNVALVKSLAFGQLDDLKGIVMRGARQGLHHTAVAQQIQDRFGITKRRAALIATDQVGKLNGELNSLRQQNIGVRRYRWSSSQDERVRLGHRALDGTIQLWTKPPVVDQRTGERGHPGQPIRCRCAPIPIIDDVLVDAGLMDPADVELGQPMKGAQVAPKPTLPKLPPTLPQPPPANVPAKSPKPTTQQLAEKLAKQQHANAAAKIKLEAQLKTNAALQAELAKTQQALAQVKARTPANVPSFAAKAGATPFKVKTSPTLRRDIEDAVKATAKTDPLAAGRVDAALQHATKKLPYGAARSAHDWAEDWVQDSTAELANQVEKQLRVPGSWAQAQYEATQAIIREQLPALQARGIADEDGYVTLYRGIKRTQGRKMRIALADPAAGGVALLRTHGVSSWSESFDIARSFARGTDGIVVEQRVHYTRAFATHYGQWQETWTHGTPVPEKEWTLLADKNHLIEVVEATEP